MRHVDSVKEPPVNLTLLFRLVGLHVTTGVYEDACRAFNFLSHVPSSKPWSSIMASEGFEETRWYFLTGR